MATFTVMPLLYFTQNLVGESLPDWTELKLDFNPPGIRLKMTCLHLPVMPAVSA